MKNTDTPIFINVIYRTKIYILIALSNNDDAPVNSVLYVIMRRRIVPPLLCNERWKQLGNLCDGRPLLYGPFLYVNAVNLGDIIPPYRHFPLKLHSRQGTAASCPFHLLLDYTFWVVLPSRLLSFPFALPPTPSSTTSPSSYHYFYYLGIISTMVSREHAARNGSGSRRRYFLAQLASIIA